VLALVQTFLHHATPSRLRIPTTFARHGEFVAFALDFGGKDGALACKIAANFAHAVSHDDNHGEERRRRDSPGTMGVGAT
jgi:hypothetical protein